MTLENPLAISKTSLKLLKKASPLFIKGWLQDEVIASYISYIYTLTNCFHDVEFCEPTTALALSMCKSVKLLWSNVNLQLVKKVLIPFDPISNRYLNDDEHHQQCLKVSRGLLSRKFRLHNVNMPLLLIIHCNKMVSTVVYTFRDARTTGFYLQFSQI